MQSLTESETCKTLSCVMAQQDMNMYPLASGREVIFTYLEMISSAIVLVLFVNESSCKALCLYFYK